MQAIQTKFIPCTNTKGSRIKAWCERGSMFVPYPHELSGDAVHIYAVDQLVKRFADEDLKRYGQSAVEAANNPWMKPRVCGALPDGSYAHVFVK